MNPTASPHSLPRATIVIVGGVAAGMSAATRYRRLDERANIVVLERSAHVSYANCGLPYHLSATIANRDDLLLQTPASLRARFNLDVRVRHQVEGIDPAAKTVTGTNLTDGAPFTLEYDALVLAPGAEPMRPDMPGSSRGLTLRNVEDLDAIVAAMHTGAPGAEPGTAAVIGGGFVGLEVAENLAMAGLAVTVIERAPQILAALDEELASVLHRHLEANGVRVHVNTEVAQVEVATLTLTDGATVPADLLIFALGVRPDLTLAHAAGLTIGPRGGIAVDDQMHTSAPDIYAVGDAAEKFDAVDGTPTLIPLANLANRHGRLVADAIAGRDPSAGVSQGTAIVQVFGLTAAMTGWTARRAAGAGRAVHVIHTHPLSHAGYFPRAQQMALKVVYDAADGTLLGAQGVGEDGVDKRIDVLAVAIAARMKVEQLADLELAYAPAFGSAKDPVNMIGYIGANRRQGLSRAVQAGQLETLVAAGAHLVDVRTAEEFADGHLRGAVNVPVDELGARMGDLPAGDLIVYCAVGVRAHVAEQALRQRGRTVANVDGGWATITASAAGASLICAPATAGTATPARP